MLKYKDICQIKSIYESNFIKQDSETVMVSSYQNADCTLKKYNFSSFIIIFSTLSFPIKWYSHSVVTSEQLVKTYGYKYNLNLNLSYSYTKFFETSSTQRT